MRTAPTPPQRTWPSTSTPTGRPPTTSSPRPRPGTREGLLPDGKYHECDIDTLGADSRGAKRLVWDEDGNIYYTADHYESFELLYEAP